MRIWALWIILALLALPVRAEWLENAPKVGAAAADFTLKDYKGQEVTLSRELAKGPVILSFYRGGWCPVCNAQLHAFQKMLPQFQEYGAQLIAVSPEKPGHEEATVIGQHLTFRVLSDEGMSVIKSYGLLWEVPEDQREKFAGWLQETHGTTLEERNGVEGYTLPVPATFVIGKDGKIAYAFMDVDYTRRANNDDILNTLKALGAH